jgi:chemotaxis methyl-accepting protein methylase
MKENNSRVTELLIQLQGFDASKYDDSFLSKSLEKRISDTHCDSKEAYYTYLQQSSIEAQQFINSLSVCYSEFFRNPLTFSVLERVILPSIIVRKAKSKQKEVRFWSAACASGQETYSLSMLLNEYANSNGEKISFRIFATDHSEQEIQVAMSGQYSLADLNNLSIKRLNKWFTVQGDKYIIKDELKANIDFSGFDLFSEQFSSPPTSIFGDFDLIVCANLLFYYKREYREKIITRMSHCLSENGFLVTGETERDILTQSGFHEVYPHSGIFQL